MRRVFVLLFAVVWPVPGQDSLDNLRKLLIPERQHPLDHVETRGATPVLTLEKHYLRDWIESRLTPLEQTDEDRVKAFQLNSELKAAGLTCETKSCDESLIGYIGDVAMHRDGGFLVVQTAVGIQCGFDESAYIYQWKDKRWARYWASEQNEYSKDKYLPQRFWAVAISGTDYPPGADQTEHLIVTLGQNPWCSSNWQNIYHRIWHVNASAPPQLLVDRTDWGYLAEPPAAAVWPNDVLLEYAVGSIDVGVLERRTVLHYVYGNGKLTRTEPFVLSPRNYVDDQMGTDKRLSRFSGKAVEFIDPTYHCLPEKDLWQVGLADASTDKPLGYVLVR
jgi:hypothetical protein